jgi:hypothetical protein
MDRTEEIKQKRVASMAKARAAAKAKREKLVAMATENNDLPEGMPTNSPLFRTRTFIYRPQDPTDPVEMTFAKVLFRANEMVEVADTVTVQQLVVEKRETAEGESRSKGREMQVPLYQVLAGNPWFEINGVKPERQKPATSRVPTSPDEWRGYAIAWIAASTNSVTMDKRWLGEDSLRRACGVSADDMAYVMPFFEARRDECADIESRRRVA